MNDNLLNKLNICSVFEIRWDTLIAYKSLITVQSSELLIIILFITLQ